MRTIAAALLLLALSPAALAQARVEGVRLWAAPDHTRVVFDISAPLEHELFALEGPDRVVVDLADARLRAALEQVDLKDSLIHGIRSAPRNGDDLRVVFDMAKAVRPKSFLLKPNEEYGHRLVIDLYDPARQDAGPVKVADRGGPRERVIAIDAGHGGEDPGARGHRGTLEKEVVLSIARRLARLVEREPGMRAVLVRDGDYYISLRERIEKARAHRADMFVSIHADAFRDRRAHGSSVYVLSRHGASTEAARWLAERENAADLVGGVSLDDKDDLLASVLLDLSQTATIEASMNVAERVLDHLERIGRVHKDEPGQAGFVVLKSPDIPSILVETAFISNPAEERKLRNARHQQRLARAMLRGIRAYWQRKAPVGSVWAAREHVIRRGETLSSIARRYQVNLQTLRSANDLNGDLIRAGQVLRIPARGGG